MTYHCIQRRGQAIQGLLAAWRMDEDEETLSGEHEVRYDERDRLIFGISAWKEKVELMLALPKYTRCLRSKLTRCSQRRGRLSTSAGPKSMSEWNIKQSTYQRMR